jgi:hypothetical protein
LIDDRETIEFEEKSLSNLIIPILKELGDLALITCHHLLGKGNISFQNAIVKNGSLLKISIYSRLDQLLKELSKHLLNLGGTLEEELED